MTEFVIRLKVQASMTRREAYIAYGEIANALLDTALGLTLVEITDDVPAAPSTPIPVRTRKPRGPNKPKGDAANPPPPPADTLKHPDFLKRE